MRVRLAWVCAIALAVLLAWLLRGALDPSGSAPVRGDGDLTHQAPAASEPHLVGRAVGGDETDGAQDVPTKLEDAGPSPAPGGTTYPLAVVIRDAETGRVLEDVPWSTDPADLTTAVSSFVLQVDAPPGYVAWDRNVLPLTRPSWAPRLEVVYPLRREVETWVTLRRTDGRPVVGPELAWYMTSRSGIHAPVSGTTSRVRGVPYLSGRDICFGASDENTLGMAMTHIPAWPGERLEVVVELETLVITFTESVEVVLEEGRDIEDVPVEDHVEGPEAHPSRPEPARGAAAVRVLRRNGQPAPGVHVYAGEWSHRSGADGRVLFDSLPEGKHAVRVKQGGLVPVVDTVNVVAGETAYLTIREPAGATLEVEVVDAEGRPRPFAEVRIGQPSGAFWLEVDGDATRLDRFTDERGRRICHHVEPGTIHVQADWGGASAAKDVVAREGASVPVRIVVGR